MVPVFLHINSSGGRYLRKKFCENYDNAFYVHHINPLLYNIDGVDKNKIIRFYRFRDVTKMNKEDSILRIDNTISVLDLDVKDKEYFTTLRNPVDRYLSELNHIDLSDNILSHNIMVKSLLVALTGSLEYYFNEVGEEIYETLIEMMGGVCVITMDKDDNSYSRLNDRFKFNTPVDLSNYRSYSTDPTMEEKIRDINKWDIKLYEHYKTQR